MEERTLYDFIDAINAHDAERLERLMAEDFLFVDAYGRTEDREAMRRGWRDYFEWFPDYLIEIEDLFVKGDTLAFFGYASGTYRNIRTEDNRNYWRLPAAWKARVAGGQISLWQVCCDSKIPYEIILRDR